MILVEITLILVAGWLSWKFGEREWALLERESEATVSYGANSRSKSARLDAAVFDWERE